jgi:hypothetical protein
VKTVKRLIDDYALLSDLQTAALVHRHGSIDWCCFPRFDSDACFAALLREGEHGRWLVAPETPAEASRATAEGRGGRSGRREARKAGSHRAGRPGTHDGLSVGGGAALAAACVAVFDRSIGLGKQRDSSS